MICLPSDFLWANFVSLILLELFISFFYCIFISFSAPRRLVRPVAKTGSSFNSLGSNSSLVSWSMCSLRRAADPFNVDGLLISYG